MIKVVSFNGTIDEYMKTEDWKSFNNRVERYYQEAEELCTKDLTPIQMSIFKDWQSGKNLWKPYGEGRSEKYEKYSDKDWNAAYNSIMAYISLGCG